MNIVDSVLFQSKCQPLALALCIPGTKFNHVTYGQLARFIYNVGRNAQSCGLVRGNKVALFVRDPILHCVLILGLTKLGIVTVSSREQNLPKELTVDAALADSSYPVDGPHRVTVVDNTWLAGDGLPLEPSTYADDSADDPCRIILTSGSTGFPKAVLRTHRNVSTRIHRLQTVYGSRFADCSRIFMDVGLSTGIGLTAFMYLLSRGGSLFLHGGKAIETFEALAAYRVQAMIASPQSLAKMAELFDQNPALCPSLDVVVSTGSLLTKALSERVRSRFGSNVISSYGSTEACVAAAGPANVLAKVNGAVGYVTPGVTVEIVSESGERLPVGKEGHVRIRSDCVVDGYLGDPEATRLGFRDGCFYPGDIGVVTSSGMLIILGREQTLINLGGDKVHPERVESAITSFAGVRDAAAFDTLTLGGMHVLGSAVVWRGDANEQGLKDYLHQTLPPVFIPKFFLSVPEIPRTSNGKIDRVRLKETTVQSSREQQPESKPAASKQVAPTVS